MALQLLMVAGELGASGVHAVKRVGMEIASGAGNAIIQPQVPAANRVRDLPCQPSLARKHRVLVRI
ncbi:hypothetical protein OS493_024528 [Desmophyllum pertusum]|uniref:Uncharacterized protein n=1 Tax=Desmophyllum pertusum TaxID=174260 RepID=A0A9W9ZZ22_9CNID|nr:hypothetical protein OS493_024528 [Desmophyllum pertusum]